MEYTYEEIKKGVEKEIWANGNHTQKNQNIVFPDGIGYNKQLDKVQTFRVNSIFHHHLQYINEIEGCKAKPDTFVSSFAFLVTPVGLFHNPLCPKYSAWI